MSVKNAGGGRTKEKAERARSSRWRRKGSEEWRRGWEGRRVRATVKQLGGERGKRCEVGRKRWKVMV